MFYSCELVAAIVQLSLYVTHSLLFFWLLEKYAKYFKFQYKNHKLCLQYFQDLKVKFGSYLFVEYGSLQVYAIVSSFQVVSPFLTFADHVALKWILTSAGYFSTVMGLIILLIGINDITQQTMKYYNFLAQTSTIEETFTCFKSVGKKLRKQIGLNTFYLNFIK